MERFDAPPYLGPALGDGAVVVTDAELALALMKIESYRIHQAGLPVCASPQKAMSTSICVGRSLPPRYREGPAASYQLAEGVVRMHNLRLTCNFNQ